MPDMSKRQAEFFTVLIIIATLTAAAILVIDFQIKGAILEQASRFRQQYEEWQNGQSSARPANSRADYHRADNGAYPSDMVASGNAGMEAAGDSLYGYEPGSAGTARPPKRETTDRDSGIPPESG